MQERRANEQRQFATDTYDGHEEVGGAVVEIREPLPVGGAQVQSLGHQPSRPVLCEWRAMVRDESKTPGVRLDG